MSGRNLAIIIGRLGQDPELRYAQAGKAVANFSVATSEEWKDKQTGEKQERTEWHNCTCFGNLAEICGKYLTKGSQVYIEGRIQTDKYDDKEGVTKYSTKIIFNQMQMLGGKSDNGNQGQTQSQQGPPRQPAPGDDMPF